jgi:hypothetical protein
MADKQWCLNQAIEIVKAFGANGEFKQTPNLMLKDLYEELKKLEDDSNK